MGRIREEKYYFYEEKKKSLDDLNFKTRQN
jgi:hypothetical protein